MKKITILVILLIPVVVGCICPDDTITRIEIYSVESAAYGYDTHDLNPEFENINRYFVGFSVFADSIIASVTENNQLDPAACNNSNRVEYADQIDSLHVFTVFDYNDEFTAGDDLSSLVRLQMRFRRHNNLFELESHRFIWEYFRFTNAPTNDSLQLRITGRVSNGTKLEMITNTIHFTN